MKDSDLDDIEKACAEATPGPFVAVGSDVFTDEAVEERFMVASVSPDDDDPLNAEVLADARLFAGARTWLPALVAEVRKLRAELDSTVGDLLREERAKAREEAAKVAATAPIPGSTREYMQGYMDARGEIAKLICALKDA